MSVPIKIVNESSVITDANLQAIVEAVQIQISRDFSPLWDLSAGLTFAPGDKQIPGDSWALAILDDSDQADALGYHDLTPGGLPIGKVFANSDIEAGSLVSVTVSHELLEMLVDPFCNLCAQAEDTLYAYEVCDAVEADALGYDINGIRVSDFVTPQWFSAQPSGPYDYCKRLSHAFELAQGGYISFMRLSGGWQQETNESKPGEQVPRGSRRERRRMTPGDWRRSEL